MDTPAQSPQDRLAAAIDALEHEHKLLPANVQGLNIPDVSVPAAINTLIVLLTDQGIIEADAYQGELTNQTAALVENLVAQARALKRQHSGLVMPGTRPA